MSDAKRMTDGMWEALKGEVDPWTTTQEQAVLDELDRARSEEARLLEETAKQAETIRALADVLGGSSGFGHSPSRTPGETRQSCRECAHFSPTHADHCAVGLALRRAGRL